MISLLIPGRIWNGLIVFQFLFAIGSRCRGGALQLADRGHGELCGPAEIMRVKEVPCDRRDFGHLAPGVCQARPGRPAYIVERRPSGMSAFVHDLPQLARKPSQAARRQSAKRGLPVSLETFARSAGARAW
jgi:hypothetical protein